MGHKTVTLSEAQYTPFDAVTNQLISKSGNYLVYVWNGALRTNQFILYMICAFDCWVGSVV